MTKYIQIHLRESETTGWLGRPLYQGIVQLLWRNGAPGITVFRGEEGLDRQGHIQNIQSEYMSDALPVTLDLVVENEQVGHIMTDIHNQIAHHDSLIFMTEAVDAKPKSGTQLRGMNMEAGKVLKVYMKEEDRYHDLPLYHALIRELQKRQILWVNVQRALEGFGADHVIRMNKVFEFANHSPVLVEVACTSQQMDELIDDLSPLLHLASGPAIVIDGQVAVGNRNESNE